MRAYVTKHALTWGIQQFEVDHASDGVVSRKGDWGMLNLYHKGEWHRTREDAVARAEQMRLKKIAYLQEQIAKLEALRFQEKADG